MSATITRPGTDRRHRTRKRERLACQYIDEPHGVCGADAAWWVICLDCGEAIAECVQHRIYEHARFENGGRVVTVICRRCRTVRARWRELFDIQPIGDQP